MPGSTRCRRSTTPLCLWASMIVTVAAVGAFVLAWLYVMFLQQPAS